MYDWIGTLARQRQQELLRDADHAFLVQQALQRHPRREPYYAPMLARVGMRLMTWGESLQARYADIELSASNRRT